jgi:hypothetical protein
MLQDLVWDYFYELINNLDIYTEESLEKIAKNEKQYLSLWYVSFWRIRTMLFPVHTLT